MRVRGDGGGGPAARRGASGKGSVGIDPAGVRVTDEKPREKHRAH